MSADARFPAVARSASAAVERAPRPSLRAAGRVVAAGFALGVLAQLLFFGVGLGINVPIAVAATILAGWRLRPPHRSVHVTDAWLPAAALAYATFVALRGDPVLVAFDLMATMVLTGAALASLGGAAVVTRRFSALIALVLRFAAWTMAAAVGALGDARRALSRAPGTGLRLGAFAPVLRGLAISLPLVLVFVALFSAADAVFARLLGDLVRVDLDLDEAIGRTALALFCGWLATGALAFTAGGHELGADQTSTTRRRRLGATEAITVLVVVDLVFVFFVILQAAYLFGGRDTLAASGLTYSEYARRGFFELIAVAVLAGGLVLALESFVSRRTLGYLAAAIGLGLCTAVVLASAVVRLRLYQEAYGWTELRFYALAGIAWLAVGVVLTLGALATDRSRWLPSALIVSAIVVGLAVNVIGPVRFVAEQNLARALDPALVPDGGWTGLDFIYLSGLGDDALLPMTDALPRLPGGARQDVAHILESRGDLLRRSPPAWQEWNLSHVLAREAAEPVTR